MILAEVITPDGLPVERSQLWNAAEGAEKRCNSVVAREIVVALPHELNPDQQKSLVQGYARGLSERTGWGVDVAIHAPGKQGDLRNTHAHLLCTTRNIQRDPSGCPVMGSKTREWDIRSSGSILIHSERSEWERCVNASLEQAQELARVDCRSHAEKQTGLEPQVHLGPSVTALERSGIATERGDLHRAIAAHNGTVLQFQAAQRARESEVARQRAWEAALETMRSWPLERLQAAAEAEKPPSVAALLERHEDYCRDRSALQKVAMEKARLEEAMQANEDARLRVHSEWHVCLVSHPWQSALNDLGVLPVGVAPGIREEIKQAEAEGVRLHAAFSEQGAIESALQERLAGYRKEALALVETSTISAERYGDLLALIKPKESAQEKAELEADLQRWEQMPLEKLEQEAWRYRDWDARRVALENPAVQTASQVLEKYPEQKRREFEWDVQQSQRALQEAQCRVQYWKGSHGIQARLLESGVIYPGGEIAGLLKGELEKRYELQVARVQLKRYEQNRAKAEQQLEQAIQRVLPESAAIATKRQTRSALMARVLAPKREAEKQRQEEWRQQERQAREKAQEQGRDGGRSLGR